MIYARLSLLQFGWHLREPSYIFIPIRIQSWSHDIRTWCTYIPNSLFLYPSLLSLKLGWFSRQHPESTQNWRIYVLPNRAALVRQCVGVHKRTLFMNSQNILLVLGDGRWVVARHLFLWCCFQDSFKQFVSFIVVPI